VAISQSTTAAMHVGEPVVAVHDAGRALLGQSLRQASHHVIDDRPGLGLRRLPLRRPPAHLAGEESLGPPEVAEPDLCRVEGVQGHEGVDEELAGARGGGGVE